MPVRTLDHVNIVTRDLPGTVEFYRTVMGFTVIDPPAPLEPDLIQISLIPYTLQHTTLGERRVGDRVHLEADTIGKYVEALWENRVNGQR